MTEENGVDSESILYSKLNLDSIFKLKEEADLMPECSEKLILNLIYELSQPNFNKTSEDVNELILKITDRLTKEDFWSYSLTADLDVLRSHLTQLNIKKSITHCKIIMEKIRPLDVKEIQRLIKSNQDDLNSIKDKPIYLLLGITGAGKSTILHYLAGSKMGIGELNGKTCVLPINPKNNKDLDKVTTSSNMKSETRQVIPIEIEYSLFGDEDEKEKDGDRNPFKKSAIFCDTPGFGDTNGAEVDISNSIILKKTIDLCSKVKPIIVVNKNLGPRFQLFPNLTNALVQMIPDKMNIKYSVNYLFNGFSASDKKEMEIKRGIASTLMSIKSELDTDTIEKPEQVDRSFKIIIEDMVDKLGNELLVINPLDEKRHSILVKLCDGKFIENPTRHFSISFSAASKQKCEEQIEKHFKCIQSCIVNNDYKLVLYKANELIDLKEMLNNHEINNRFQDVCFKLIENLDKHFQVNTSYLIQKLDNGELLHQNDLNKYAECLRNAMQTDLIVEKLSSEKSNRYSKLRTNLETRVKTIHSNLEKKSIDTELESIKKDLQNLQKISKFSENNMKDDKEISDFLQKAYKDSCDTILYNIKKYADTDSKKIILSKDLNSIVREMNKIEKYSDLTKGHGTDLTQVYTVLRDELVKIFEQKSLEAKTLYTKSDSECVKVLNNSKDLFKKLNEIDFYFNTAKNNQALQQHLPVGCVSDNYQKFLITIRDHFSKLKSTAFDELERSYFEQLEFIFNQFVQFKENVNFNEKIGTYYQELNKSLVEKIEEYRNESMNIINRFRRNESSLKNLKNHLENLSILKWFDSYRKSFVTNCFRQIEDIISETFEYFEACLKDKKMSIDQFDDFKEVNDIINKMICFEDLFGFPFSTKLSDRIKKRKEWLNKKLDVLFELIRQNFDQHNQTDSLKLVVNYDLLENSFKFIEISENSLFESFDKAGNFTEAKSIINNYLTRRAKFVKDTLRQSFDLLDELRFNSDKIKANEHADIVFSCLNEIDMAQNYEFASRFFNDLGQKQSDKWRSRLKGKLISMERQLISLREQNLTEEREELLSALLTAKTFSMFDEYLFARNSSEMSPTTFSSLYYQYSSESHRGLQDLNDECKQYIDMHKYLKLRYSLRYFAQESQTDKRKVSQLRSYLVESLVTILSEVKRTILSITNNLDNLLQTETNTLNNSINNIIKYLHDYCDANSYLSEFIYNSNESNLSGLNKELDDVKLKLQALIYDFKAKIIIFIREIEFDKSGQMIKILKKFKPIADLLNDQTSQDLIKNSHKNTNEQSSGSNSWSETLPTLSLNSLEELKTNDLRENYKALSSQEEFAQLKKQIDQQLKKLVEHELDKAKKFPSTSLETNQILQNCKQIVETFLPIEFRVKYADTLISQAETEIESQILDKDFQAKKTTSISPIDANVYENLLIRYKEFLKKNDLINCNKIKQHVFEKIEQNIMQSENEFNSKNYVNFMTNFKNFLVIYDKFSDSFTQIKNYMSERYQPRLDEISQGSSKEFFDSLRNPSSITSLSVENLANCYKHIFELSKLNLNVKFTQNLAELNDTLVRSIEDIQPEINNTLNSFASNVDFFKTSFILTILFEKSKSINTSLATPSSYIFNSIKLKKLIVDQATQLASQFKAIKFISDSNNRFQSEYEEFFEKLFKNINDFKKISDKFDEFGFNLSRELGDCIKTLVEHMNKILDATDKYFEDLLKILSSDSDTVVNEQHVYFDFMNGLYNLKSYQAKSSNFSEPSKLKLKNNEIDSYLLGKIRAQMDSFLNSINSFKPAEAAKKFSKCKEYSQTFFLYKSQLDYKLDCFLNSYVEKNGGLRAIGQLAPFLKEYKFGSFILTEHKIFESYQRALFMSKTSLRDINVVIEELEKLNENNSINGNELKNFYLKYDEIFKKVVNDNLVKLDLIKVASNLITIANGIKVDPINIQWDNNIKTELANLTAHAFALWTLLNSKDFFKLKTEGNTTSSEFLFQAHPAQVLSIARMLGIGYKDSRNIQKNSLNSCLIQIGTGQGKSITLAITAILLTLLGFEVYCVCYSRYLSDRDFDAFKELFDNLKLTDFIHYGTFNKICELIVNQHGILRDIVSEFIFKDKIELDKKSTLNVRPKILLIDEVDVFFSKNFYGNDYKPISNLAHTTISRLIDLIWSKRHSLNSFNSNMLQKTQEYADVCQLFGSNWKSIVDSAIRSMITDLASFKTHDYEVIDGKIGYVEHDTVSFDINYGYKTLFAYYLEHENKKISDTTLSKMKSIIVKLGSFSFAEIPKIGFRHILGVTGTLNTLSKKQEEIIQNDYKIYLRTIIPSIYKGGNFTFNENADVCIASEESYVDKLTGEIRSRIVGKDGEKRAVFVFFENKNDLINFKNSDDFQKYFGNLTKILTEQANVDEKNNVINNAASSNRVVLFTKVFGRGTDFITHDEKVRKSGVHVIQTFFSDELSEEVQIKGRTARQGEPGSYSMVLLDKKLEKYQLFQHDINSLNSSEYYKELNKRRTQAFANSYDQTIQYVAKLKLKHDLSIDFFENLKANRTDAVRNYLQKLNENMSNGSVSKTLILIDATCSMSGLLEKAKLTLQTMFERAFNILNKPEQKLKYNNASFLIKIAVYRNYNSKNDLLLQNSSWESEADNLTKFLQSIYVEGGWGNEAIEIGLWQANKESNLSQVILIGDARANTKNEVDLKRAQHSTYYKKGLFQKKTFYEEELNQLIAKGVRVNAVYLKNGKPQNQQLGDIEFFKDVASKSDGKYEHLDLDSSNSSQALIDLVTKQVLFSIGGDDLVEAYRRADW